MKPGLLARLRGGDGRLIAVLAAYALIVAGIVGIGSRPALAAHHTLATCLTAGDGHPAAPLSHPADHCDWCFVGTTPALEASPPALRAGIVAASPRAAAILVEQARFRLGWAAQPSRGPPSKA
jgi:hypothetical protein